MSHPNLGRGCVLKGLVIRIHYHVSGRVLHTSGSSSTFVLRKSSVVALRWLDKQLRLVSSRIVKHS